MQATKALWLWVAAPIAAALGCGGSVTPLLTAGDDSSYDAGARDVAVSDGHGGPDEGTDARGDDASPPWSPVCAATPPAAGSPCTLEGTQCEYGSAWWSVSCDVVMQCQNGTWSTFRPSFDPCSPEPGPNATGCPATYGAVPQGGQCTDTNLSCVYAQAVCACLVPLGGPVMVDGGGSAYWGCVPEPGCPMPRPRLGSACATAGTSCTYEACSYAQTCQGGVWQGQPEACAGAQ